MRVLVIARPRFPVSPEQLPGMAQASSDWLQRQRDSIELAGVFPGGGGFGIVNVPDAETLNQLVLELPFTFVSELHVEPFVDAETGFRALQELGQQQQG